MTGGVLRTRQAPRRVHPGCPAFQRAVTAAIRAPNTFAVSRSPGGGASSGVASAGDCDSRPAKPPTKFRSLRVAAFVLAGIMPMPAQIMPCCIARVMKYWIVENLSPFIDPEFVKPAATLSFHFCANHGFELASANFLKSADGPPM